MIAIRPFQIQLHQFENIIKPLCSSHNLADSTRLSADHSAPHRSLVTRLPPFQELLVSFRSSTWSMIHQTGPVKMVSLGRGLRQILRLKSSAQLIAIKYANCQFLQIQRIYWRTSCDSCKNLGMPRAKSYYYRNIPMILTESLRLPYPQANVARLFKQCKLTFSLEIMANKDLISIIFNYDNYIPLFESTYSILHEYN